MPFSTYAELTTLYSTLDERTYSSAETDEAIALAEAKANRLLAQDFRRRSVSSVNLSASGVGTIPTGFVGLTAIVRDVIGSLPLKQVSYDAFIRRNPYETSDDADTFALLSATEFQVAPVTDDNYLVTISGKVSALSSGNTTNWLLTLAPDYYIYMGRAALSEKYEDYAKADRYEMRAINILSEIVSQGNVAEYGNVEMAFEFITP